MARRFRQVSSAFIGDLGFQNAEADLLFFAKHQLVDVANSLYGVEVKVR